MERRSRAVDECKPSSSPTPGDGIWRPDVLLHHSDRGSQYTRAGNSGVEAFLQSQASALDDRILEPYGVRKPGRFSLSARQPNRVQARAALLTIGPLLLWPCLCSCQWN